jgi:hypothetical protein
MSKNVYYDKKIKNNVKNNVKNKVITNHEKRDVRNILYQPTLTKDVTKTSSNEESNKTVIIRRTLYLKIVYT